MSTTRMKDFVDKHTIIVLLVISFLYWGLSMLSGMHLNSWDGLTHIFFAKGYSDNWWSIWDDRWYGGFNKASYPPLAHQIIGLLILLTGQVNLSYSLVLLLFTVLFPLAVYKYARVFLDNDMSLVTAFISIFLPSVRVITFVFGQFAGFVSLIFLLFSVSAYADYFKKNSIQSGVASVGWLGCVAASHTSTFFFLSPMLFTLVSLYLLVPIIDQKKNWLLMNFKIVPFYILISLIVIFPFWVWFFDYDMQAPIMHPSRWNMFDLFGTGIFRLYFLDMHKYLLIAYFALVASMLIDRKYYLVLCFFILYFLLGMGGSTKLPSILFGEDWEWLTYERFSFWAQVIVLPLIGYGLFRFRDFFVGKLIYLAVVLTILDAFLWLINPSENQITRQRVDLDSVYSVFSENDDCTNRFLALGFDYQLPEFSIYSNARTFDGLWHTARTDMFLRQSGMGSLDSALYWENGEYLLREYLMRRDIIPAKCIFINETNLYNAIKYKSILMETGWRKEKINSTLISLWVKEYDFIVTENKVDKNSFWDLQVISWGGFPLITLAVSILFSTIKQKDS